MTYTARDGSPLPPLRGVIHTLAENIATGTPEVTGTFPIPGELRDFLTHPTHLTLSEGPIDERLEGVVDDEIHSIIHGLKNQPGEPAQVYGAMARKLGLPNWEFLQGKWRVELLADEGPEADDIP